MEAVDMAICRPEVHRITQRLPPRAPQGRFILTSAQALVQRGTPGAAE